MHVWLLANLQAISLKQALATSTASQCTNLVIKVLWCTSGSAWCSTCTTVLTICNMLLPINATT